MREGFENWKDKLEGEDAQDMVPGFDAQATWQKLQPRIAKKQPMKWQLFAAAMLVGLLIGAAVMRLWTDTTATSVTMVKNPTQVIKETVAVHDTVYAAAPVAQPQVHDVAIAKTVRKQLPKKEQQILTPTVQQPQETVVAQQETPKQKVEETIAAAPKPKQRVLHLMDIENEDTKMVLSAPRQPQRANAVTVFSSHPGADINHKASNSRLLGISLN